MLWALRWAPLAAAAMLLVSTATFWSLWRPAADNQVRAERAEREARTLQGQLARGIEDLRQTRTRFEESQLQLAQAKREHSTQLASLQATIAEQGDKLTAATGRINELRLAAAGHSEALRQLDTRLQATTKSLNNAQQKREGLETQLAAAKKESRELRVSYDQAVAAEKSARGELAVLTENPRLAQAALNRLRRRVAARPAPPAAIHIASVREERAPLAERLVLGATDAIFRRVDSIAPTVEAIVEDADKSR